MVKRAAGCLAFSTSLAVAATALSANPARDYQIGDVVEKDIVTPFRLTVIDEAGTQALREKEVSRIQVVVSYDSNVARAVESNFIADFDVMRADFLEAYRLREPSPPPSGTPEFLQFWRVYCQRRPAFPLSSNLAAMWANRLPDEPVRASWRVQLRAVLGGYIREEGAPGDIHLGRWVRMIPRARSEDLPGADVVERLGTSVAQTNIQTLSRATNELLRVMGPEQRILAEYLASFVAPNCAIEAGLTETIRANRTDSLTVAEYFEPGQVVARRGQTVDAKIKAALDLLKEKAAPTELQKELAETQAKAVVATRHNQFLAERNRWLLIGSAVLVLALLFVVWQLARRKGHAALLPAVISGGAQGDVEGVAAKLAELLKDMLIQRMVEQRLSLLEAQRKAAQEVAEMEARLEKLHAPLQERLAAYEKRICDLEKELAARTQENKFLIESKILLAKRPAGSDHTGDFLRRN